ncbi:MAG: lipid-A-disaccharide synthase [Lysobacterales bacterium]
MNPDRIRIALVAGESSGDQLGAALIAELRTRLPGIECAGVAGPLMRAAGCVAWHDSDELAVMGLAEVVTHLPRLLRLRAGLRRRLLDWQPDLFIGIDAPDFNLGLERRLKLAGMATVHYVSPSVWAWREHRAKSIGASADQVLCLFPMEPAIYARHGVAAHFVGHPLASAFALQPDRGAARAALGIDPAARVLAVLPGSRGSEIARLAPAFIAAALRCQRALPGLRLLAPMASAQAARQFRQTLATAAADDAFDVLDGQAHTALVAADAVLLASGTAALEAMLAKRPMVVGYRLHPLSHWLVRRFGLLKSPWVALPNILAGTALVPELLQQDCTTEPLTAALLQLLDGSSDHSALIARFTELHRQLLAPPNGSAAAVVAALLDTRGGSA